MNLNVTSYKVKHIKYAPSKALSKIVSSSGWVLELKCTASYMQTAYRRVAYSNATPSVLSPLFLCYKLAAWPEMLK
jgi:hypothetical protein